MKFDVVVLGAGMVGVSTAAHLAQRGLAVALVDRQAPGNETSFGNGGLIQHEGVYPYAFPRRVGTLLRYARNRELDVRYHLGAMPRLLPFLYRYWQHSRPDRHTAIARTYAGLIAECVNEHATLAKASAAMALIRQGGWIRAYRSAKTFDRAQRDAQSWADNFGIGYAALDAAALRRAEPSLGHVLVGGVRYTSAQTSSDPGGLVKAYAAYFESLGGRILLGDATTLRQQWQVDTHDGPLSAHAVVIALGPWSDIVTKKLGYRLPLAVKRGYHMHYATQEGAHLNGPVLDADKGFLLAPMVGGIRLTTGVEFGARDSAATPVQLDESEPAAREAFPLGARLDPTPWLGHRPCTPDMLPIIGPARHHRDLWFAFGHAHHGFTLGPVTGRLISEMMTGSKPFVDPRPFSSRRFGE